MVEASGSPGKSAKTIATCATRASSFQRRAFYDPSRPRWRELARVARSAYVFADFPDSDLDRVPAEIALAEDAPLRREWTVVCDSTELAAALTAWELPGQGDVPDRDRLFESVWTVEPAAVRDAARVCAAVAAAAGAPGADAVVAELAEPAPVGFADLASVTTLFNRVVAYVDAAATSA